MQSTAMTVVMGISFAILFLVPSLILWTAALRNWTSGNALKASESRPVPWGVVDLAIAMGIWLMGAVVGAFLTRLVAQIPSGTRIESLDPSEEIAFLGINGLATLGVCVLIAAILFVRHQATFADLGWNFRFFATDLVLGLKAFVMLAPVVYGIQMVLTRLVVESKHPLIEMLKKDSDAGIFLVAGFAAVIVAPIAEEFLFRVLLQGWLERLFSGRESNETLVFGGYQQPPAPSVEILPPNVAQPDDKLDPANPYRSPSEVKDVPVAESAGNVRRQLIPILVSSFFFALSHWSHGPDPIPLFVFAMGLGYLYQRTHRIVPCIFLHLLLNACSLAALWMTL